MKHIKKIFAVAAVLFFVSVGGYAQWSTAQPNSGSQSSGAADPPPFAGLNDEDPVDPPPDPIDTPFDGGLIILTAAAVAYGVRKKTAGNINQNI